MIHKSRLLLFLLCCYHQIVSAQEIFNPKIIANAKKSVVTIAVTASLAPYSKLSKWSGTGFIVDKKGGYILTNQHVIGTAVVGSYELTFYNGIQVEAKAVYYDSWLDYGFLKVDPNLIPNEAVATLFSTKEPLPDEPVFIIGNNENQSFSIHKGVIADSYHVVGSMPQQAIQISLNTAGGSSGSPIFNRHGAAIGLNYASNGTFSWALHPAYIRYALSSIQQGKIPVRKHIGAFVDTYAVTDAIRYDGFPRSWQKNYLKKFPQGTGRMIQVVTTLRNTPAAAQLLPGDIIWAVDGKEIGPSLVNFDLIMNGIKDNNQIELTIFRKGIWQKIDLPLYDLEAHKITKMVHFGGATFFESNDFFSKTGGLAPKTLTFALTDPQHIFDQVKKWQDGQHTAYFRLEVLSIDGISVSNLDELVEQIPILMEKKYFTIEYVNAAPQCSYNCSMLDFHIGHDRYKSNVAYNINGTPPTLYTFDQKRMEWIRKSLSL